MLLHVSELFQPAMVRIGARLEACLAKTGTVLTTDAGAAIVLQLSVRRAEANPFLGRQWILAVMNGAASVTHAGAIGNCGAYRFCGQLELDWQHEQRECVLSMPSSGSIKTQVHTSQAWFQCSCPGPAID
jgi:hypothetical protein